MKLTIGYDLMMLGNSPRARTYFREVLARDDSNVKGRAWLLEGVSFARDGDWQAAEQAFMAAPSAVEPEFRARAIELAGLAAEGARLPRKSPALAGALSLVPGLGYLYSGYPETAISSLIVNELFMAATYKAFADGNKPLGAVLGFFSLGWYGGNITGSISTAHRRNAARKDEHILKFNLGFRY